MSNDESKIPPGKIIVVSDPEYIGNMPIRQDVEILPADETKEKKIGWFVKEYMGSEIYRDGEDTLNAIKANKDLTPFVIKSRSGIKSGDKVFVPGFFGWHLMEICKDEYGQLHAENDGSICSLVFGEDDRECWCTVGMINKRAIKRLQKTSKEEKEEAR